MQLMTDSASNKKRAMQSTGFLGLGMMGGAIAQRLLGEGVKLVGYDPDAKAMDRFCRAGGVVASSPREVADRAELVFASLPSQGICRQVALGESGVANGDAIKYYVETSTMGAGLAKDINGALADRQIEMIDAPVSGGATAAAEGRLSAIVAGSPPAVAAVHPVIDLYASRVFHVGQTVGSGQLVKLINNSITIFGLLITFEALSVGDAAGIDRATLIDVINASSGQNFASRVIIPEGLLADSRKRTGHMGTFAKDVTAYLDEARRLGLELKIAPVLIELAKALAVDPNDDVAPTLEAYFCKRGFGLEGH